MRLTFEASTIYIPTVTRRGARVHLWGGGGAGGGGRVDGTLARGGGGGGGGAHAIGTVPLTKGVPLMITVSPIVRGGAQAETGFHASPTWVGSPGLVLAVGGGGGGSSANPDVSEGGLPGRAQDCKGTGLVGAFSGGAGGDSQQSPINSGGGSGGTGAAQAGNGVDGFIGFLNTPGIQTSGAIGGGDGGAGAPIPTLAAQPHGGDGFVPGGGGGGGSAGLIFSVSCVGFSATITRGLAAGAYWLFDQVVVSDWHSLVIVEDTSQYGGGVLHFSLLDPGPYPNGGPLVFYQATYEGDAYAYTGYIEMGLVDTFSGELWFVDTYGTESNHAPWSVTIDGT